MKYGIMFLVSQIILLASCATSPPADDIDIFLKKSGQSERTAADFVCPLGQKPYEGNILISGMRGKTDYTIIPDSISRK